MKTLIAAATTALLFAGPALADGFTSEGRFVAADVKGMPSLVHGEVDGVYGTSIEGVAFVIDCARGRTLIMTTDPEFLPLLGGPTPTPDKFRIGFDHAAGSTPKACRERLDRYSLVGK